MKIIRDSIWSSVLTLVTSIISFGSQLLIAKYFGTSYEFDNYLVVTSIPTLIAALIASGFNYAVLPEFVKRINVYENNIKEYILSVFILTMVLSAILILVLYYSIYLIKLFDFNSVYSNNKYTGLMYCVWLNSFVSILLSVTNCYFNAIKKFKLPIILNIISYLFSISLVYFFNGQLGIVSIALGLLIGSTISLLTSVLIIFKKVKFPTNFKGMIYDALSIIKKIPIAAISMLSFSIYQTVDSFWATSLGTSNLSYLGYGQRIIIAFGALIIAGPFTVFVPKLTNDFQSNDQKHFYDNILSIIKMLFIFSVISGMLFSLFSTNIISILFERGKFSRSDTNNLSAIIPLLMIGMVFMLSTAILFRVYFITGNIKNAIILSIFSSLNYTVFSGVLSKYFLLKGICFAYILSWLASFSLGMIFVFKGRFDFIRNLTFFRDILFSFSISLGIFFLLKIILFYYKENFTNTVLIDNFVYLILSITAFFLYIIALLKFRISEMKILMNFLFPS